MPWCPISPTSSGRWAIRITNPFRPYWITCATSTSCVGKSILLTAVDVAAEFRTAISQGAPPSIRFGIADLDDYITMCEGELTVLAGRAGMGKTAVACQIAQNACAAGKRVLFFSLEMPRMQLWARMACAGSGFTWMQIKTGRLTQNDLNFVAKCSDDLAAKYADRFIIEDSVWRIQDILRIASVVKADLVIVDNLGEIEWHEEGVSETVWYGRAARTLRRDVARRLKCHVLLLHHINRDPDKRQEGERRPMLSDLRWSGDIERLSDAVIFMYREDQYSNDPAMKNATIFPVELWVRKNRYGVSNACAIGLFNAKTLLVEKMP